MARLIEFHVPATYRTAQIHRLTRQGEGRIIKFVPGLRGRYIWLPNGALWPLQDMTIAGPAERRSARQG